MSLTTSAAKTAREQNRRRFHRALRSGQVVLEHQPLEVQIELTNHCNIHCIFCAREHDVRYLTKEIVGHIPTEIVRKLDGILETCELVFPQGFGEPFLHKEFLPIIERCKSLGAGVMFNTNGTVLPEEWAERLVKAGVDFMTLSLDGGTKETFERLRVGARFDRILENMRRLNAIKIAAGTRRPEVFIEFIGMTSNFHELPRLVEIADEIGATRVHVEPLVPYTKDLERERIEGYESELYRGILEAARERARELGIDLVGVGIGGVGAEIPGGTRVERSPADFDPGAEADGSKPAPTPAPTRLTSEPSLPVPDASSPAADLVASAETDPVPETGLVPEEAEGSAGTPAGAVTLLCAQPFSQVYVERDGRVRTCCYGVHDLGNLNDESMEEIWNGPRFRTLRRSMWTGKIPFECEQCVQLGRIPPVRYEEPGFVMTPPDVEPQGRPLSVMALVEETPDVLRDAFHVEIEARCPEADALEVSVSALLDLPLETGLATRVTIELAVDGAAARPLGGPMRADVTPKRASRVLLNVPVGEEIGRGPDGATLCLRVIDDATGLELASATTIVSR